MCMKTNVSTVEWDYVLMGTLIFLRSLAGFAAPIGIKQLLSCVLWCPRVAAAATNFAS